VVVVVAAVVVVVVVVVVIVVVKNEAVVVERLSFGEVVTRDLVSKKRVNPNPNPTGKVVVEVVV